MNKQIDSLSIVASGLVTLALGRSRLFGHRYVPVCTDTRKFSKSTYRYIHHKSTSRYIQVRTGTYRFVPTYTRCIGFQMFIHMACAVLLPCACFVASKINLNDLFLRDRKLSPSYIKKWQVVYFHLQLIFDLFNL